VVNKELVLSNKILYMVAFLLKIILSHYMCANVSMAVQTKKPANYLNYIKLTKMYKW